MRTVRSLPYGGRGGAVSVQGISVQGGLCLGVSVQLGLCPGGAFCPGAFCPGGSLSRGSSVWRLSVWGVSVQGALCPGDLCPEGSLSRGASVWRVSVGGLGPGGSLSRGVSLTETPLWTESQTCVKTVPCHNFIAGGNNRHGYSWQKLQVLSVSLQV